MLAAITRSASVRTGVKDVPTRAEEAEVLPEVQGAGENGVRTMAPEKQGTKQVGPPAASYSVYKPNTPDL
jgi:hypothetical protein